MKSVEYKSYGDPEVLHFVEQEKPSPKENEILLKISASSVTKTETIFRQGKPYFSRLFTGLTKPKNPRLGEELAGEIIEVGNAVTKFKVGDNIFGTAGPEFGANAEFISLPEDGVIALKPENLSFTESASNVDGFLTALPFLRDKGNIKKGDKVLIYGASGSIGTAAVQIAKYYGAEVTAVASTKNLELLKSLGADYVIDYKNEDFTKSSKTYDIIFDTVGKISYNDSKKSLSKSGIFLEAGITLGIMPFVMFTSLFTKRKAKIHATGIRKPAERRRDLELLKKLMEEGEIIPVVDKTFKFENIVDAHRYVDLGHKKGNVAISFN
ncbi:MAG: NAD(P)-dependent alcohol dehydrogenase [Melioribacteraceae bacterium]|nr:NAD(P)-dependent alcohol dehydrogenase [Melioribacteraceae bacterium]MCF8264909.1 NAD(P)-dependent alcohol dehydrogenase [Melioribacteraceae bacterium]MCF8413602.1 NAD(P)-dependent alcohol dehydrogenase [Melioribacteraceae bacterium]MCF8430731.1 NAD(P)-dependent alcohol dehydrogenase [Melioribacteraceae bacterium]